MILLEYSSPILVWMVRLPGAIVLGEKDIAKLVHILTATVRILLNLHHLLQLELQTKLLMLCALESFVPHLDFIERQLRILGRRILFFSSWRVGRVHRLREIGPKRKSIILELLEFSVSFQVSSWISSRIKSVHARVNLRISHLFELVWKLGSRYHRQIVRFIGIPLRMRNAPIPLT